MEQGISFASGAVYGLTSVVVGQPLDTIKTRMQARPGSTSLGAVRVGTDLFKQEGVRGLYRGGMPLFIGGALFRSAQFGCYESALTVLRKHTPAAQLGSVDLQVAAAGLVGGLGRGITEAPFEYIKVRRQVDKQWEFRKLYQGSSVTLSRNAILFCSFSIYRDIIPPLFPGGLGPFWTGAICANLAWITCWPLDVVKSQVQSGNYAGKSTFVLLSDIVRSGILLRGLLPGLARSTVANGCAMVMYKQTEGILTSHYMDKDKRT